MSGGLVALLDDIATLAKVAAASIDDVGVAAGRAGAKAAGVVVDDAAVTPQYVHNFAAERELPIIKRIAKGSLKNKLLFILPAALLLSQFLPWLLTPLLMLGGTYLCYEGAEKVWEKFGGGHHGDDALHSKPGKEALDAISSEEHEKQMVAGAVRTDFILSGEIMVIALNEVAEEPFITRSITLLIVAIGITILVYGVVGLIVKADDVGLHLAEKDNGVVASFGRGLVKGMPTFMKVLSTVGLVAMLWVGGHILLVGIGELGFHWPYDQVHNLEEAVYKAMPVMAGFFKWLTNTALSGVFGLIVGVIVVALMHLIPRKSATAH